MSVERGEMGKEVSEGRLNLVLKAMNEWLKQPNHINHKTHCDIETSPSKIKSITLSICVYKVFTSYRIWDMLARVTPTDFPLATRFRIAFLKKWFTPLHSARTFYWPIFYFQNN